MNQESRIMLHTCGVKSLGEVVQETSSSKYVSAKTIAQLKSHTHPTDLDIQKYYANAQKRYEDDEFMADNGYKAIIVIADYSPSQLGPTNAEDASLGKTATVVDRFDLKDLVDAEVDTVGGVSHLKDNIVFQCGSW